MGLFSLASAQGNHELVTFCLKTIKITETENSGIKRLPPNVHRHRKSSHTNRNCFAVVCYDILWDIFSIVLNKDLQNVFG